MNRQEFMRQLKTLLLYVPTQEREEALQYYNDYFDDAGPENEYEVIAALGSPAKVAENIKRDINQNYYGVEPDKVEPGKEMVEYHSEMEIEEEPMNKQEKGYIPTWAKIVIIVCAGPILLGLLGGLFGAVFGVLGGIVGVLFGLVVTFGVLGLVCPLVGAILIVAGIVICMANIMAGLGVIGIGMIILAVGILGIMLEVMLIGKWIPALVKAIGGGIRKLGKKGKEGIKDEKVY